MNFKKIENKNRFVFCDNCGNILPAECYEIPKIPRDAFLKTINRNVNDELKNYTRKICFKCLVEITGNTPAEIESITNDQLQLFGV